MKIVIVGNGIAGNEVASDLLRQSSQSELTIISAEPYPEYDPCSLPYYLSRHIERNFIFRRHPERKQNSVEVIFEDKVNRIDPRLKQVFTGSHRSYPYDKLVLAYGSDAWFPPIEGIDKKGVFGCKRLADVERLLCHRGGRAVVIGSGAIGVEFAVALKTNGYQVTLLERQGHLLPTLFDETPARLLEEALEREGISVLTGEKVLGFEGDAAVEAVVTDQRTILCDTVLVAAGVMIDTSFVQDAAIQLGRGIWVNRQMETNVKDIYACGDCAEAVDVMQGERCLYQLKHNAIEQAHVVAKNILGGDAIYPGAHAFARIHFYDTYAASFGKTGLSAQDDAAVRVVERHDQEGYVKILFKNNAVIGAQAIGKYALKLGVLMNAMWNRVDIFDLKRNQDSVFSIHASFLWFYRELVRLIKSE